MKVTKSYNHTQKTEKCRKDIKNSSKIILEISWTIGYNVDERDELSPKTGDPFATQGTVVNSSR